MTVAGFMYLSVLYSCVDYWQGLIDDKAGEDESQMVTEIFSIYELLSSAVTIKNGTKPKYWYYDIEDCNFTFSLEGMKQTNPSYPEL